MYVYVLREEVPYEEDGWLKLVKDDEFAIYKIKKILIESVYEDIAKSKRELKSLEEYNNSVPHALTSDMKYYKREAEKALEKLEECIGKIGGVENSDEFSFYNKRHNTLSVEKVKVI